MSLISTFYNTVTKYSGTIKEIFYNLDTKTVSTPNISVEPIDVSTVGQVRLKELAENGVHYVGFKAPDSLTADLIFKLPATDGTNTQVIQTDGSGNLSFVNASAGATSIDDFTSTGQTQFTASVTLTGKKVLVMHNGVGKRIGADYDYTISGSVVTFTYTIPDRKSVV